LKQWHAAHRWWRRIAHRSQKCAVTRHFLLIRLIRMPWRMELRASWMIQCYVRTLSIADVSGAPLSPGNRAQKRRLVCCVWFAMAEVLRGAGRTPYHGVPYVDRLTTVDPHLIGKGY
jgi:hypothetical protein